MTCCSRERSSAASSSARVLVVEMAEGPGDALLQPLRIGRRSTAGRGRSCTRAPARPGPESIFSTCAVGAPMSVSTPRRAVPSESTNCTGSRASCGTVKGMTSIAAERLALPPVDEHHAHPFSDLALGLQGEHGAVGEVDHDAVRGGEVEHAAGVVAVLVRDEDAGDVGGLEAEARAAALGVAQVEAAVEQHPRALGFGDQAVSAAAARERSEAKQRYFSCSWSSARMRCAVVSLGAAVLVEDVHHARFLFLPHLHAVLLGLDLGLARAEQPREEAALGVLLLHVALGVGVAHEVQAVLAVAVLDREPDAVEREADAAPGAVERLVHLQQLACRRPLANLGAQRLRAGGRRRASPAPRCAPRRTISRRRNSASRPGIGVARLPSGLAFVAALVGGVRPRACRDG